MPPRPEYAATVGPTREYLRSGDGTQPGDPAKAAQAMFTTLKAPDPPLRLVLSGDAIDSIRNRLESLATELGQWEAVACATDFVRHATDRARAASLTSIPVRAAAHHPATVAGGAGNVRPINGSWVPIMTVLLAITAPASGLLTHSDQLGGY